MIIGKDASASDIMRWDFSVMGAKSYVLQLSENVKRSLEWKLKKGECIGAAPLGYLNDRDEHGNGAVVIDPVRGLHRIRQRHLHAGRYDEEMQRVGSAQQEGSRGQQDGAV